jgi:hypothetical protein
MKRLDLRGRILLAIGAGGVVATACGGAESTRGVLVSDAADDATGVEGGDSDIQDGTSDAFSEAAADAVADATADTDARTCGGPAAPCTTVSDCCPPALCANMHCFISVRRPFLVGSSLRMADAAPRGDWLVDGTFADAEPHLDAKTAAALARDWLHDGCEEHASIAAFARFTMHLLSVGAPPEMINESQRASLDEVNHARACFALARRYGGRTLGPGPLALDGAMNPMTLEEIAALTAEEGCVGETLGVLLAEEQLARATDPVVRSLLVDANIVADEGRHAELAWAFVSWAVAQGGEPVRRAVAAAIRRAVDATLASPIRSYDGIDVGAWRAHGRLTCEDAHAVAIRGVRQIVEPCAAALLGLATRPESRSSSSAPA